MSLYFYLNAYKIGDTYKGALFSANITHNVVPMADFVGIYKCLWRPEEHGFSVAKDIIPLLEDALKVMKKDKEPFLKLENKKWGRYKHFIEFIEKVLDACKEYPDAYIEVSR
jgi:hypothetical protein